MKHLCLALVLLFTCSIAQAQITLPENQSRFSLNGNLTYEGLSGLSGELNLGVKFGNNYSAYFGVGGNGQFHKYVRTGVMRTVYQRNRFAANAGLGAAHHRYDYSLFSQGTLKTIDLEASLQLDYQINSNFSVNLGGRIHRNLYRKERDYSYGNRMSFQPVLTLGATYHFGRNGRK